MFCERCPSRVLAALEGFDGIVSIEKSLTIQDPILRLSYTPEAPRFTLRQILYAISDADEAFEASVHHPQSLEDHSRQIYAKEQRKILSRVLVTAVIAVTTLVVGIIYMNLVPPINAGRQFLDQPFSTSSGVSRAQWTLFVMATPVYFICADLFHKRAIKEVRALWRKGDTPFFQRFYRFGSMNLLISLGTSIAYMSSVAQLIVSVASSEMANDNTIYFDSVVFLTFFLLIGRLIESYSKSKTRNAVTMLVKMRPTKVLLVNTIGESRTLAIESEYSGMEPVTSVDVDLIELGDVIQVQHGASPPCDGVIVEGRSTFDESSLTGESKPVKKTITDTVFSGASNEGSAVIIRITGVFGFSMLDQVIEAVREGQTRSAPIEHIADTLTGYFVPCIVFLALITWVVWLVLGYTGTLPDDYLDGRSWIFAWSLQFSIAVFVVACPCGLALAAPTALFVGGGLAAKHGILVKGGGEAFEKASKTDCIAFDKTGTLDEGGEPRVTNFEIPDDFQSDVLLDVDREMILGFVHAIEGSSSHTVAKAIVSFCKTEGIQAIDIGKVEEIPGKGMKATSQNESLDETCMMVIGNEALMSENNVVISSASQRLLDAWKSQGRSVALAAIALTTATPQTPKYHLCAIFSISDAVRAEAPGIIAVLQKRGIAVWMISGDNHITANAVGSLVGIPATRIIAGVLPHQKSEQIQYLQQSLKASDWKSETERALVAMVGDGINDSLALTTVDVGIAIGGGSDIAISSAEFVLMTSNLNSLVVLLDLSRFVLRGVKFNFVWALIYNVIALPFAAGVLYPIVSNGRHIRLDPVWASLAMALSSLSVVFSSLALRSYLPGIGFRMRDQVGKSIQEQRSR